jgi:hypothetical protein
MSARIRVLEHLQQQPLFRAPTLLSRDSPNFLGSIFFTQLQQERLLGSPYSYMTSGTGSTVTHSLFSPRNLLSLSPGPHALPPTALISLPTPRAGKSKAMASASMRSTQLRRPRPQADARGSPRSGRRRGSPKLQAGELQYPGG